MSWREEPTSEVNVFQYTRCIFGTCDSPTCANFALQQTARDSYANFQAASSAVLDNFYLDDFLGSVVDPNEALNLSKELVSLLSLGGFKVTKFVSNVPDSAEKLNPENSNKLDCNISHNALLHGAEKIYPAKDSSRSPAEGKTSSHSASLEVRKVKGTCVTSVLCVKELLQNELKLSSNSSSSNSLVLCDSACSHSWVSAQLAEKLNLSSEKLILTVSGINSQQVLTTERVEIVISVINESNSYNFHARPFVKIDLNLESDAMNVSEFKKVYPYLTPVPSLSYQLSDVELILGQECFHAIRPLEFHPTIRTKPKLTVCVTLINRLGHEWSSTIIFRFAISLCQV